MWYSPVRMNDMITRRTAQKPASRPAIREAVQSDRRVSQAVTARFVPIVR